MQVHPDTGTLAPFVPRALLARLARPIDVLAETVECTVVFADVSGFTRLSERLARRGNEGGEQLVDVINACFTALLAEAYGRGGSLVKFGGDAMVLLFYDQEGNQEHALRACCAAAAMRRRLRDVGRVRAGDSNVVLRMSVGVHSGEYAMFVVGGSHREFVIGGPAASTVVALEAAASAGQILLSPETARRCLAAAWAPRSGPGVLLARSPTAWMGASRRAPEPERRGRRPAFCPSAVRAHLLSGSAAPEHRTATIAFLQFGGLDEVIARDGLAGAAGRLDEARATRPGRGRALRRVLPRLGHRLRRRQDPAERRRPAGGGDDEERMLLALRHIVEAGPPLPVRVGVHRGPVFTAQVGPGLPALVRGDGRHREPRGPAGGQGAGGTRVRHARRLARREDELRADQPEAVRGQGQVAVRSRPGTWARRCAAPPKAAIRLELPLVGRLRELDQLRSADRARAPRFGDADRARGRDGQRQVAAAGRGGQARPWAWSTLRAGCEVYTRDTPYSAWRGLLRQLLGVDVGRARRGSCSTG